MRLVKLEHERHERQFNLESLSRDPPPYQRKRVPGHSGLPQNCIRRPQTHTYVPRRSHWFSSLPSPFVRYRLTPLVHRFPVHTCQYINPARLVTPNEFALVSSNSSQVSTMASHCLFIVVTAGINRCSAVRSRISLRSFLFAWFNYLRCTILLTLAFF